MKRPGFWSVIKYLVALLFAKSVPAPAGLEDMVRRRLDAMALQDIQAYNATTFPESLALVNDQTRPAMEWMTGKDFGRKVPRGYKLSVFPIDVAGVLPFDEVLDYPARPTHGLKITYQDRPGSWVTLIWHVLEREGKWYVLVPAPDVSKPAVADLIEKTSGQRVSNEKKIQDLYFRADPGELSKLREMIRMDQKSSAIQHAKIKLRLELTDAKAFIDLVEARS